MKMVLSLLLVSMPFFSLVHADPAAKDAGITWITIQDDDGERESHWGAATSPQHRICKIIDLGIAPSQIHAARISYVVGFAPYHSKSHKHFDAPKEGIVWANVTITLNGTVVARRPAVELVSTGEHRIEIPCKLLRRGANRVVFAWEPHGKGVSPDASYGYFYLGIDTDRQTKRSCSSTDGGRNWSYDVLRAGAKPDPRWRGEYMVRLEIALPNGTPEKDGHK